jgi:amidase
VSIVKQATILVTQAAFLGSFPVATIAATFNLVDATIADINAAFDAGALNSQELTQLYLNRINAYDDSGPNLNSLITVNPDALQTAAALDVERQTTGARSPLHGVPIIVKDNYNTFDLPTTAGAIALEGFVPTSDAYQVEQLRDAGAIILGKANLSEFAFSFSTESSLGGVTLNPYDPTRSPGGSSGGTGAAIAASFGTIGLGTDTGGSIRIPSSFDSLVGVRPTIGLSSRDGIIPLALSQDVGGPMTRTVADAAVTLDYTVGFDPEDPITETSIGNVPDSYTDYLDPNGLEDARIGVVPDLFGSEEDPEAAEVNAIANEALAAMESAGAEIVEDVTIENLEQILAYPSLSSFEFKSNLNDYLAKQPNAPVKSLEEIIASGGFLPSNEATLISRNNRGALENDPEYLDITQNRPTITQEALLAALEENDLDALVFPTSTEPAALLGEPIVTGSANRLSPFSGFPEITVPAGYTSEGLPVGISFLGEAFSEPTLIKLAYAYEQESLNRLAPATTPALPGEVFEYEPIPEPSTIVGLALFGFTALAVKFKRRQE